MLFTGNQSLESPTSINEDNKTAFGQFLWNYANAKNESDLIKEITPTVKRKSKGLGPANLAMRAPWRAEQALEALAESMGIG